MQAIAEKAGRPRSASVERRPPRDWRLLSTSSLCPGVQRSRRDTGTSVAVSLGLRDHDHVDSPMLTCRMCNGPATHCSHFDFKIRDLGFAVRPQSLLRSPTLNRLRPQVPVLTAIDLNSPERHEWCISDSASPGRTNSERHSGKALDTLQFAVPEWSRRSEERDSP